MSHEVSLAALLRRGGGENGVYYHLPGSRPKEALASLIDMLPVPQCGLDSGELLKAVLEREELMPTAMGNGIALPHPRNPLIEKEEDQFVAIAFPENEIDWGALDGKKVHSIILIVSASAKTHLFALQRISYFCRDETFCSLLKRRAPAPEIIQHIEKTEQGWS